MDMKSTGNMVTKHGELKSQIMHPSSTKTAAKLKKRSLKSVLPLDASTFLILALLVRALLLLPLSAWFGRVRAFELIPIHGDRSFDHFATKFSHSNQHNIQVATMLRSSITDHFSKTEATRKTLTNDEVLNGASKTTQLLLQTPPEQTNSHRDFRGSGKNSSATAKKERTLYDILGAVPTATKEELKRQYIIMAKLTHPDALISRQRNGSNNEMFPDFAEVAQAYQILSDPMERKKYDRTLYGTQAIQILVLLGDICIGTTLTVAEITSAVVWVTLMVILQPIAVHVTTELFYLSIDDSSSFSK
jgi:hypothetical protein